MNSAEFRKELVKIMPGYRWTVHRSSPWAKTHFCATGIQSAGFNRLSTLQVDRWIKNDEIVEYEVKSAGFGKRAPWLSRYKDGTLARALRGLQDHYKAMANNYSNHASALKFARKGAKQGRSTMSKLILYPERVSAEFKARFVWVAAGFFCGVFWSAVFGLIFL